MEKDELVYALFASEAHLSINKELARKFGLKGAVLLADLISKYRYFKVAGTLDDGMFYNSQENIEKDTTLTQDVQLREFKKLAGHGLLTIKRRGMPAANYFRMNFDAILYAAVGEVKATAPAPAKPKKERKAPNTEMPEVLKTEAFEAAWARWLKHRQQKGATMTPLTIEQHFKFFVETAKTPERAIEFIEHGILKGWQFPYEPKNGNHAKPSGNPKREGYYQGATARIPGSVS